jgi:hypothetical protein
VLAFGDYEGDLASVMRSGTARYLRTHGCYPAGLVLVAIAVLTPIPLGLRVASLILGGLLLLATLFIGLGEPAPTSEAVLRWGAHAPVAAKFPRTVCAVSVLIGAIGASYLWAVFFGDGLHGLEGTAALDQSGNFPNANAALIAAIALYSASLFGIGISGLAHRSRLFQAWVAVGVLGAAPFAISQLFV